MISMERLQSVIYLSLIAVSAIVIGVLAWSLNSQNERISAVANDAAIVAAQARVLAMQNQELAKQGKQAHDGLCAFKGAEQKRLQTSRQFLRDNPNGIPGIPPSVIFNSISNSEQTVKSLEEIQCE